jgi:hypothetical protein
MTGTNIDHRCTGCADVGALLGSRRATAAMTRSMAIAGGLLDQVRERAAQSSGIAGSTGMVHEVESDLNRATSSLTRSLGLLGPWMPCPGGGSVARLDFHCRCDVEDRQPCAAVGRCAGMPRALLLKNIAPVPVDLPYSAGYEA